MSHLHQTGQIFEKSLVSRKFEDYYCCRVVCTLYVCML
nr:MAG TPA: hypothetical protein [Caudoviricetes sp.]